jgi:hypothetical protein
LGILCQSAYGGPFGSDYQGEIHKLLKSCFGKDAFKNYSRPGKGASPAFGLGTVYLKEDLKKVKSLDDLTQKPLVGHPDTWFAAGLSAQEKQRLMDRIFKEGSLGRVEVRKAVSTDIELGAAFPAIHQLLNLSGKLGYARGVQVTLSVSSVRDRQMDVLAFVEAMKAGKIKSSLRELVQDVVIAIKSVELEGYRAIVAVSRQTSPELHASLNKAVGTVLGQDVSLGIKVTREKEDVFGVESLQPVVAALLFKEIPQGLLDKPGDWKDTEVASVPNWLYEPYDEEFPWERFVVGIGGVEQAGNRAAALASAEQQARDNVAQQIRTQVISQNEDTVVARISGDQEQVLSNFRHFVQTRTNLELPHCRMVEPFEDRRGDKHILYVRAILDRSQAAAGLKAELDKQVSRYQETMKAGQGHLQQSNLAAALDSLLRAKLVCWDALATEALLGAILPAEAKKSASSLSPAEVDGLLERAYAGLTLAAVSGHQQSVAEGAAPQPLVCRLTWKGPEGEPPVRGFPLTFLFQSGSGRFAAGVPPSTKPPEIPACFLTTGDEGTAAAEVDGLKWAEGSGPVRVAAALDVEALLRHADEPFRPRAATWLEPLRWHKTLFTLRPASEKELDFQGWLARLTKNLVGHPHYAAAEGVLVGAFTYRDLPAAGPFGEELRDAFLRELSGQGQTVRSADPDRRFPQVSGTYWDDQAQVEVRLQFRNAAGVSLFSLRQALLREKLPTAELAPKDVGRIRKHLVDAAADAGKPSEGGLKVEVWTNHGERPVFRPRELLEVFVKPNRDCYVHLIYTDTSGTSYYLLPNAATGRDAQVRVKAGETRRFPDPALGEDWKFRFNSKGIGMESLKAVASTAPLPDPLPAEKYPSYAKAGFRVPDGGLKRELLREYTSRGPDVELAAEETVEAFCSIQVQQ